MPAIWAISTSRDGMAASALTPCASSALPAYAPPLTTSLSLPLAKSEMTFAAATASSEKP